MTKQTGTLALLIAIVALTGGCVASPGGLQPSAGSPNEVPSATVPRGPGETQSALAALSPEDFWTALVPGDPAAVSYSSMEAILADADAVVLASLGKLTRGPAYADKYGNVSYWGVLTLEVDRVLHGSLDTKTPERLPSWCSSASTAHRHLRRPAGSAHGSQACGAGDLLPLQHGGVGQALRRRHRPP